MALSKKTLVETTTGEVLPLSELTNEHYVYSCRPSGRIYVSKIENITKTVKNVFKITFTNGNELVCDKDQLFALHNREPDNFKNIKNENYLTGCRFNPNNNMIFDHSAKLFIPSEKVAYETYNLFNDIYGEREILKTIDTSDENRMESAKYHMMLIQSVTKQSEQLLLRLSNDNHLLNILQLEYLTYAEVGELLNHYGIELTNKEYSDNEYELLEILMNNAPLESYTPGEDLIEFLKAYDLLKIGELANDTNIQDDITKEDLDKIALELGYSAINHLTSVKCYYGTQISSIEALDSEECCTIELAGGDSIGLSCGIFVNTKF
jgi:hypothetical protein